LYSSDRAQNGWLEGIAHTKTKAPFSDWRMPWKLLPTPFSFSFSKPQGLAFLLGNIIAGTMIPRDFILHLQKPAFTQRHE
jgi:hypothetical protein